MKHILRIIVLMTIFAFSAFSDGVSPREFIFSIDRELYSLEKTHSALEKSIKLNDITQRLTQFIVKKGLEFNYRLIDGKPLTGSELEMLYRLVTTYRNLLIYSQDYLKQPIADGTREEKLLYLHNHLVVLQSLQMLHKAYIAPYRMRNLMHSAFRMATKVKSANEQIFQLIFNIASKKNQKRLRKMYKELIVNGQLSVEELQIVDLIHSNKKNVDFHKSSYINIWVYTFIDHLGEVGQDIEYGLSKAFGNVMGEIKFRKGYMYEHKKVHDTFIKELKPLDIIIERSPFAFTDMTIPGHWTHPAIWLGTEEQLKELGIWDHPVIKPYQQMIREGRRVLEALRPGIEINPLSSYMNTDEILHMRVPGILDDKEAMLAVYQRGLSHFGQVYDFNFNSQSTDVIVCSELIFQAFGDIYWPMDKVLGRHSVTPDNIASLIFFANSPVEFLDVVGVNEKKEIYRIKNKNEFIEPMGIELDKERKGPNGEDMYNLPERICEVKKVDVRVGSRRRKGNYQLNVCKTHMIPANYDDLVESVR